MSDPLQSSPSEDALAREAMRADGEEIDALPVLAGGLGVVQQSQPAGAFSIERRSPGALIPVVQAAAVAAGGFVAGAAVVGLVNRHSRHAPLLRKARRGRRELSKGRGARAAEIVQIVGSRSLLVDVHLLGSSPDR